MGSEPAPEWLQTAWLLSQFGTTPAAATAAYIDHVRAGIGLPSIWSDLKSQLYLGDDAFAQTLAQQAQSKATHTEIPRAQRRAAAPPLAHFVQQDNRNHAIARAYATGCYSLQEIGQAFGLHYATVSRVVRAVETELKNK